MDYGPFFYGLLSLAKNVSLIVYWLS